MVTPNGDITKLRKLIQEGFPEGADETSNKYIDRLFAVWDECTKAVGRYIAILLVAMTTFEFINRAIVKEFTVGPLKVVDVSIIKTFLPVFASYFMFRIMSELIRWRQIERVHTAFVRHFYPAFYKTNLALLLQPISPLQANPLTRTEFTSGPELNFLGWFQYILGSTLLLLVPTFDLYAYWQLFAAHGSNATTIVSAAFSALLLGAYATLMALYGFAGVFAR